MNRPAGRALRQAQGLRGGSFGGLRASGARLVGLSVGEPVEPPSPPVIPGWTGNLPAALKSERGAKGFGGPQERDWPALGPFWKAPKAAPPLLYAPQWHIRPRSLFKFSRPTSVVEPGWRGSRFSRSLVPPPWRNQDSGGDRPASIHQPRRCQPARYECRLAVHQAYVGNFGTYRIW